MVVAMCELFAMSSAAPAGVNFSFHRFAARGGGTGPHADGWGVGWYEGRDLRLVREPEAASGSACVRLLESQDVQATLLVSHIRKATQGDTALANTQPFTRELAGRVHVFAHNGDLSGLGPEPGRFHPVGTTDSELAFCHLMDALAKLWGPPGGVPPLPARLEVVAGFAARLAPLGPANFLYSDGDALFFHGNRRTQPGGGIEPPGLWMLCGACEAPGRDLGGVRVRPAADAAETLLVASVPLTTEGWRPLAEGEVGVARAGRLVASVAP